VYPLVPVDSKKLLFENRDPGVGRVIALQPGNEGIRSVVLGGIIPLQVFRYSAGGG
jgi:hypothetical protein